MVDELTLKMKKNFNLSEKQLEDDVDREVWRISTAKPEAYKYYIEAEQLENLNYPRQVIPILEKAIKIDPEFTMAYRLLGAVNSNLGNKKEMEIYLTKAYELRDRVPEIEKRWITADYLRLVKKEYEKAIDAYQSLFELAPNHPIGHLNLSGIYDTIGDTDKAIEHREISRQNYQQFALLTSSLGDDYEEKGMYEKARQVYQDYINDVQDIARMHVLIAHTYYYEGKYDEAINETEKALALDPNSASMGRIYHLQGDFEAAEKDYKRLLDKEETNWKMNARRDLEILCRTRGQYEKAKKETLTGLDYAENNNLSRWRIRFYDLLAWHDFTERNLNGVLERAEFYWKSAVEEDFTYWQVRALWWKILALLGQDNIEEALVLAQEVKKIVDNTPNTKDIRGYWMNLGLIEVKRENYSKAIDLFIRAYELLGGQRTWIHEHAYILYNLASAYQLNGDLESARKEYENILALTTGRVFWGDLYIKSYYQLGKIHEEMRNKVQAIKYYEQFLDLWKDADPGLPEVEDAKKKLAGLKSEQKGEENDGKMSKMSD
jgi:tetratricopeptide (TPR) repeat protein